jgi:hypothetical protein
MRTVVLLWAGYLAGLIKTSNALYICRVKFLEYYYLEKRTHED